MDYYADIENRKSGVYKIINLVNGKMYIGCSKHIFFRWQGHKASLISNRHGNCHLQSAWNKYGKDNFSFEILEICAKEDIFIREDFWVKHYNSTDDKIGYNIRLTSSTGNPRLQEQTKRKLSKAKIETRSNKAILQFNLSGKFVKEWENIYELSKEIGVHRYTIGSHLNDKKKGTVICNNSLFVYKDGYIEGDIYKKRYFKKHEGECVYQYSKSGELVNTYTTTQDAGNQINKNVKSITHVCRQNLKRLKNKKFALNSIFGFVWSFNPLIKEDFKGRGRFYFPYDIHFYKKGVKNFKIFKTIEEAVKNTRYKEGTIRKLMGKNYISRFGDRFVKVKQ